MAGNSKNFLPSYQNVTSGDMSGNIISLITDIRYIDNIACQLIFTGTPVGAFFLDGSLNYSSQSGNSGTWTPITLNPAPVATGSSGDILLDLNQLSFPYIRIRYTRTSGTGTLNSFVSGKAV